MVKALARVEAKKMLTRREQALIEDSAAGASEAELRKKADANSQKVENSMLTVQSKELATKAESSNRTARVERLGLSDGLSSN
jgi:hypothetical protein